MKLQDLIKSNNWMSIELTLLKLYQGQVEAIDEYRNVFFNLQLLEAVNEEMLIVLTEYECDTDEITEKKSTYVDVAGRKPIPDPNSFSNSYAIEFVRWENWLGMEIAPETLANFNELEIVAHCLFEMTFCGYEQDEIQEEFNSINKTVEDYKNLSEEEEKKKKTISLEELMNKNKTKGSQ